jgi:putative spermidine/putrescine transport system permease protein
MRPGVPVAAETVADLGTPENGPAQGRRRGALGSLSFGADRVRLVRGLMLLPVVVLFLLFFVWPLVEILMRSLDAEGRAVYGATQLDLSHYGDIVSEPVLRRIFRETFVIAAVSTAITAALAVPTAYLLTRISRRFAAVLLVLLMLPFWVSIVVRLFSLQAVLGHEGIVNKAAQSLGIGGPYDLLFNSTSTVIGMVTYLLPYMVLLLYAGMSGVDHSLITAARSLGASRSRAFTSVYIPLVRASVLSGVMLIFVLSLGFYLTPKILGGPENTTAPIYIQAQITNLDWGTASATGMTLLLVTLAGYVLALRFGAGRTGLGSGHGGTGKGNVGAERLRFGPASVILWSIAGLSLVFLIAPLLVIMRSAFDTGSLLIWPPDGWSLKWISSAVSDPKWTEPFWKSVVVATATAAVSTAAALVMARSFNRIRSKRSRAFLEALVLTPLIVPIILFGVGLYSVESRLGIDGTDLGLVVAHSVLAIPISFVILAVAMARIDPSQETVAWSLGASRTRAFWTVVAPRITPSVLGSFVSAFVISWDEAVVAFLVTGFDKTLPVAIFSELNQGGDPSLAAVATLLILMVVAGVILALVIEAITRRLKARRRIPT